MESASVVAAQVYITEAGLEAQGWSRWPCRPKGKGVVGGKERVAGVNPPRFDPPNGPGRPRKADPQKNMRKTRPKRVHVGAGSR